MRMFLFLSYRWLAGNVVLRFLDDTSETKSTPLTIAFILQTACAALKIGLLSRWPGAEKALTSKPRY